VDAVPLKAKKNAPVAVVGDSPDHSPPRSIDDNGFKAQEVHIRKIDKYGRASQLSPSSLR
jgi:hypothetical protein